ncbi:MAG: undecaprenyl-diphosphate phosphatase [Eubacteriales bacterium]|nr:undecaprenyl-diphosphate phosphatase [Eubacteriales bacterium]MDD4475733.1 undecaprenyl-diphosphate phosphatase [Eubacteriales bacterium]
MDFIEIIKTIIIGIIEGITEWLPISSTGHMILADEILKLNVSDAFKEMFMVVIQLGAIMAVVVLYFNKLNPLSPKKSTAEKSDTWKLWVKVLVASVPAGVIGLLFDDKIDELFYNYVTVAVMLILYGIFFILIERRKNVETVVDDFGSITYKTAFLIGIFQMLALIPGTSRSGATIVGAMLLGLSRFTAAEFSFFLAIPAMFGASAYKLLKFGFDFSKQELVVLVVGMAVSFLVSIAAIKLLMGYIKKNDFKPFGYYRIILGIIVLLYFAFN